MFFAVFDLEAVFLFAWCVAARGGRRQRAPVTAFVATTSTTAIVALLLRYFYFSGALEYRAVFLAFSVIAIASMCAGNLLGCNRGMFWRRLVIACGNNLKRIEKAWFPVS